MILAPSFALLAKTGYRDAGHVGKRESLGYNWSAVDQSGRESSYWDSADEESEAAAATKRTADCRELVGNKNGSVLSVVGRNKSKSRFFSSWVDNDLSVN